MKMERAKLQRRINREIKKEVDTQSQSCASLSDDSDEDNGSPKKGRKKPLRGKI
jgi:hypothetical protein